jgi:hypothetical protein
MSWGERGLFPKLSSQEPGNAALRKSQKNKDKILILGCNV